jgi:hypothetical protein
MPGWGESGEQGETGHPSRDPLASLRPLGAPTRLPCPFPFPPDAWLEQPCVSLASQERLNELEEEEKDAKKDEEEAAWCRETACHVVLSCLLGAPGSWGRLHATRCGTSCPSQGVAYPVWGTAPLCCHGVTPPQDEEAKKAKEKEKEEEEAEKKKLPPSERIKKLRMDPLVTGFTHPGFLVYISHCSQASICSSVLGSATGHSPILAKACSTVILTGNVRPSSATFSSVLGCEYA